jgi:hypothetical protein
VTCPVCGTPKMVSRGKYRFYEPTTPCDDCPRARRIKRWPWDRSASVEQAAAVRRLHGWGREVAVIDFGGVVGEGV